MAREALVTNISDTEEVVEEIVSGDTQEDITNLSVGDHDEDESEVEKPKGKDEEPEEEEEFEDELQPSEEEDDKELTMRDRVFRERRTSAERQAEIEARVFEAESKAMSSELRGVSGDIRAFEADLATYRIQLAEAKEKGDTKAELDLTDKLSDVRVSMLDAQRTKRDLESKVEERKKASFNPAEQAFLKLNPWFTEKERYRGSKYDKLRSSTIQLDRQLGSERQLDPTSHEYFRELDVRLRKKHPDVFGKRAEQPKRAPVGGGRSSPGGGKASPGKVAGGVLRERMEALHMNPNDPKQVAAWLRAERGLKK